MVLIACIDETEGMAFNKRRLSQDTEVRKRILEMTSESVLHMNGYSQRMFGEYPQINASEDFPILAAENDFCYVENIDITPFADKVKKIILYKWNRAYPNDLKFGISLSEKWIKVRTEDFVGKSHKKITEEIYEKAI